MTTVKAVSNSELRRTLADLRSQLSGLDLVLAAEHAAVRDFDAEALERAVAEKSAALAGIVEIEGARLDHLAAAGLVDDAASMRLLTGTDGASTALWLEIEALTRRVSRAMEANAVLLHAHHRLAIDSLHALYGDRGEPELYQDHAELRPRAQARSLGRI